MRSMRGGFISKAGKTLAFDLVHMCVSVLIIVIKVYVSIDTDEHILDY